MLFSGHAKQQSRLYKAELCCLAWFGKQLQRSRLKSMGQDRLPESIILQSNQSGLLAKREWHAGLV